MIAGDRWSRAVGFPGGRACVSTAELPRILRRPDEPLASSFASAVLLFLLYFQQVRRPAAPPPGRFAEKVGPGTFTSHWHLLMAGGVVAIAAGDRSMIDHPMGSTSWGLALAIVGGPGMFLIGCCLFDRIATGRIPRLRLGAVLLLFALTPALRVSPPLLASGLAKAVLLLILFIEGPMYRRRPQAT
ncbi:low temperature requirement protein A [Rugosimonospora acidiphila]|uniref:low temperature requirement protein A n=1 Tax=Rugosimonospora acidiphila TaxID=556531 RepID=UPI003CD0A81C